jgi:hypothetical protein
VLLSSGAVQITVKVSVNTAMKLPIPEKVENLFDSYKINCFSKEALFHEISYEENVKCDS